MDGDPATFNAPSPPETAVDTTCIVEVGKNCPHDGTSISVIPSDVAVDQSLTPGQPNDTSHDMEDDSDKSATSELSDMEGFETVTSRKRRRKQKYSKFLDTSAIAPVQQRQVGLTVLIAPTDPAISPIKVNIMKVSKALEHAVPSALS